jgi:predicted NAD-dependent protein-ADP-ribosyltransferase YbiA (DUF1768 family)
MNEVIKIWNDEKYKCGGFYEIAIQVEDYDNNKKAKVLLEKLFQIENIIGPFDNNLENKKLDLEYYNNIGIIEINKKKLPFKIHHISGDNGINWLDISIYTAMLEKVLGNKYQTWNINGNVTKLNEELDKILITVIRILNAECKIQLGILGFEVSGMYEFDWLIKNELTKNDTTFSKFFINKSDLDKINLKNKNKVILL